jgi:hypothetical protein
MLARRVNARGSEFIREGAGTSAAMYCLKQCLPE